MKPPTFLFIETTTECNLRCRQCHMWLTKEPPDSLRTSEKVALVEQFAAWSPGSTVVLTGGETMQKRDEFFALTRACRANGLSSAANTNATFIDDDVIDALLVDGPHYLVVSLDSHRHDVHDWIRGQKGTAERVLRALTSLIARKRKRFPDTDVKIMTNTIVFDRNVNELGELVSLLTQLGVDGIMFQALSRTFLLRGESDAFFNGHFPRDVGAYDAAIDSLRSLKDSGAPIVTTENDFGWMKLYARNPDFLGEQVCGSHERNMMVDQRGDVQLCFSMRGLMGGRPLGNVRQSRLRELWAGAMAAEARGIMAGCRQNCGMLNCHRRLEA